MIRKAVTFQLKPGSGTEYERRHNPIWPELEALIRAHGAHNYSIFLLEKTGQLFAYLELEDEARWARLSHSVITKEWGSHMSDIMEIQPDGEPVANNLKMVFHLD